MIAFCLGELKFFPHIWHMPPSRFGMPVFCSLLKARL
jgi:hypothetical protein